MSSFPPSTQVAEFSTAANGFLFIGFDAGDGDGIGTPIVCEATNAAPINLTGHQNVTLSFQHNYHWWQDTRGVRVSGDNGATWTEYQLTCGSNETGNCIGCGPNANFPNNQISENPVNQTIDISDVAGGQSQVLIQFYYNDHDIWAWYWAVDDVNISVQNQYDVRLNNVVSGPDAINLPSPNWSFVEYSQIPIAQIAPIDFFGEVENVGASDVNATFTATIPGVYSGVSNPLNMASSSLDTIAVNNPFTPPAVPETYTVEYNLTTAENDADLSNNTADSYTFSINDFIYAVDTGTIDGVVYSNSTEFDVGNTFHMYNDQMLYALDVVIHESSVVGAYLKATLYSIDIETWNPIMIMESDVSTLTAQDIGNTMTLNFESPEMLFAGNDYLVTITSYGGTEIATSGESQPGFSWIYYYDNGSWYYTTRTPMVRMNFNPGCGNNINANATVSNNCQDALSDGSISVLPDGGSGDYSYAWLDDNGVALGNSATIENLSNGSYFLSITDNNNTCDQNFDFDYEITTANAIVFEPFEAIDPTG